MKNQPKLSNLLLSVSAIILIYIISNPTFAQETTKKLLIKADSLNLEYPQEKIYLHLDRQSYLANDDIWFKAYVLNSPVRNFNLTVELINPAGEIVYKNLSLAQYGLSYGDFHLADTISTGMYQIRAYTSWMRNFDDAWFFRKNLLIINPRDATVNTDSVKLRKRDIDLQFFPEGGTFLVNQKNRVAFKAVDENGNGIDLEGEIVDNNGVKITDFKSNFKGMGSFVIEPEEDKKYLAKVTVAGQFDLNANLPKPQKYGVTLAIDATDTSAIYLQVSENLPESRIVAESNYLIVGQAGGSVCFAGEVDLSGETGSFKIDKNMLPGGIVKFTLFDENMLPRCERLVFNNHLDTLHIEITPDKPKYKPREEVEIDLKALNSDGLPTYTNLSMSVISSNAEYETEGYQNNIFSYFLLDSELKGTIEEPAYYFKNDSISTLITLDNLMLTHGYRYFEWEEISNDKIPEIEFQPDSSLSISGRVTSFLLGKPLADCKISMISVKSLLNVYEAISDSVGDFRFSDLYFKDTVQFSMQAKSKKERQNTWIELYNEIPPPEIRSVPSVYISYKKDEVQTYTYLSDLSPELLKKKWHLSDTILLGDVNVVAKKKMEDDGLARPYLEADYVIDLEKIDVTPNYIFKSIEGKFPGVRLVGDNPLKMNFYARGERVKIYMDGMEDNDHLVDGLPSEMFDKVEYIKSGITAGINYSGGILFFYSKRGMKNTIPPPVKTSGMESARIIGYSVFRKFYSPKYKANETPEVRDDFRRTIYWDPLIRTYSDGKAQISFYNSDESGKINVIVEGINEDGKLCRGTTRYIVTY